jgi:hypothetical protein
MLSLISNFERFVVLQLSSMKRNKLALLLLVLLGVNSLSHGASMVLNGIYQGKDLYVKNPFSDDGVGFCVFEVQVNGEPTRDEINSSAFAIDFNVLGLKVGTKIEVIIKHKEGCAPLILNPEAIKPHSTFETKSITVDRNVLQWTTEKESGALPFIVEQYRWNKWVKAGEVMGEGSPEVNTYKFEVTPHSGENRVRVKQIDYTGKPRYSSQVTFNSKVGPVTFEPKKAGDDITFSAPTRYEIFDRFGNLVKTGFGKTVNVANLEKGAEFYINYDNSFGETFKKR